MTTYQLNVTLEQKRDLITMIDNAAGVVLKVQRATDDAEVIALLQTRINRLRATYAAVQDATEVTE